MTTKQKVKVTLAGVVLAKPGMDFVYEGSDCSECEEC